MSSNDDASNANVEKLRKALDAFLEYAGELTPENKSEFLNQHDECRSLLMLLLDEESSNGEQTEVVRPRGVTDSDPFERLESIRAHSSSERYQIRKHLARGGQGAVYEVWDGDLHRHLAMKIVHGQEGDSESGESPPADRDSISRFLEEAQITGQLNHPGVVPVHEMGLDENNQVFFTMQLVRGENLHEIFEKVQKGEDDWTQVRALGAVLKACEALAYAHSKKVIHRDLKPSNLMVGKFGEVYVMDWGLARVLDQEDAHDIRLKEAPKTRSLRTDRKAARASAIDSPLETMGGRVLGTPSYMPPEQATGSIEQMGPPSDVYSMGTVLYQLLTGRVPYVPKEGDITPRTVLGRVIDGPPKPITKIAPQSAPELVAICERAMSRKMTDRYPDMTALAIDIRAYLEGHVVAAYEQGAWAELKKWVGRNKGWAGTGVAAVLLLVVALTWAVFERDRFARAKTEAEMQTAEAEKARDAAELSRRVAEHRTTLAWKTVHFQANLIEELDVVKLGDELRRDILDRASRSDPDSSELQARLLSGVNFTDVARLGLRTQLMDPMLSSIDGFFNDTEAYAKVTLFSRAGDALKRMGLRKDALPAQEKALEQARKFYAQSNELLHPDVIQAIRALGITHWDLGNFDEADALFQEELTARVKAQGPTHLDTLQTRTNIGQVRWRQKRLDEAAAIFREVIDATQDQKPVPALYVDAKQNLGNTLLDMIKPAEALAEYESILDERRKLGDTHLYALRLFNNIGNAHILLNNPSEAVTWIREALTGCVKGRLGNEHPLSILVRRNLGYALFLLGERESIQHLEAAFFASRRVNGLLQGETPQLYEFLYSALLANGQFPKLEKLCREQVAILTNSMGTDSVPTMSHRLSLARAIQHDATRYNEAEQIVIEVIEKSRAIQGIDPNFQEFALQQWLWLALQHERVNQPWFEAAQSRLGDDSIGVVAAAALARAYEASRASARASHQSSSLAQALVDCYQALHESNPEAGHDRAAAEWITRLQETEKKP